jgi:hypothetical protein
MAFLSISSPDPGSNMVENRFAAQIASYLSTVTGLGCLIASLLLVRQAKCHETAQDAVSDSLLISSFLLNTLICVGKFFGKYDTCNTRPGNSRHSVCLAVCLADVVVRFRQNPYIGVAY